MPIHKAREETFLSPSQAFSSTDPMSGSREMRQKLKALEYRNRGLDEQSVVKAVFGILTEKDELEQPRSWWIPTSDSVDAAGVKNQKLRNLRLRWLAALYLEADKCQQS